MTVAPVDARIPVRLRSRSVDPAPEPDALLVAVGGAGVDGTGWAAVHPLREAALAGRHPGGCACCGGRNGFSRLLGELFRQRATGILPFFAAIVVWLPAELERAAAESLIGDPLSSSRYRLAGPIKRKLISD